MNQTFFPFEYKGWKVETNHNGYCLEYVAFPESGREDDYDSNGYCGNAMFDTNLDDLMIRIDETIN